MCMPAVSPIIGTKSALRPSSTRVQIDCGGSGAWRSVLQLPPSRNRCVLADATCVTSATQSTGIRALFRSNRAGSDRVRDGFFAWSVRKVNVEREKSNEVTSGGGRAGGPSYPMLRQPSPSTVSTSPPKRRYRCGYARSERSSSGNETRRWPSAPQSLASFGHLLAAETKGLLGLTGSGELEGDGKLQSLAIVVARRQRLCGTAPEAADTSMKVNEGV